MNTMLLTSDAVRYQHKSSTLFENSTLRCVFLQTPLKTLIMYVKMKPNISTFKYFNTSYLKVARL